MFAALVFAAGTASAQPSLPANRDFGLELSRLSPSLKRFLEAPGGVLVWSVVPGSPADQAGFERGDVIVVVNQINAWSPAQLSANFAFSRGEQFHLVVSRGGVEAPYTVTMPDRDRHQRRIARAERRDDEVNEVNEVNEPDDVAGLQARIDELEAQLAER